MDFFLISFLNADISHYIPNDLWNQILKNVSNSISCKYDYSDCNT